jgi:tripartite-type tricarboxylate transporter receptor subunit TctC
MKPVIHRRLFAASLAVGAVLAALPAGAQTFPNRPITLVVPFAAGGSTDIVARIVGQKMGEILGQNVIIENRAGAGGSVGGAAVAKAAPDGYTILMGTISTHAINPAVLKNSPTDPVKDFAPISLLVDVPSVLVVTNEFPAKNAKELIEVLKANPDKYSYASSGVATPQHLGGELFKTMTGTKMQHIPYRGGGPALQDVVSGKVAMIFDNLPSSAEMIRAGKVRAIGITVMKRSPAFPDLPTIDESGLPGFVNYSWNALFAPANTPKDVVARLNAAANQAIADPVVARKLADLSAVPVGSTPDVLGEHVKRELAKWGPIAKAAGASLE